MIPEMLQNLSTFYANLRDLNWLISSEDIASNGVIDKSIATLEEDAVALWDNLRNSLEKATMGQVSGETLVLI